MDRAGALSGMGRAGASRLPAVVSQIAPETWIAKEARRLATLVGLADDQYGVVSDPFTGGVTQTDFPGWANTTGGGGGSAVIHPDGVRGGVARLNSPQAGGPSSFLHYGITTGVNHAAVLVMDDAWAMSFRLAISVGTANGFADIRFGAQAPTGGTYAFMGIRGGVDFTKLALVYGDASAPVISAFAWNGLVDGKQHVLTIARTVGPGATRTLTAYVDGTVVATRVGLGAANPLAPIMDYNDGIADVDDFVFVFAGAYSP